MFFKQLTQKQSCFSRTARALASCKTGSAVIMLAVLAVFVNSPSQAETVIVSTLAGSGEAGSADGQGSAASFNVPRGITIDQAGNLYVTDWNNHSIRKITPNGEVSTLAGGRCCFADGQGQNAKFWSLYGIAIDAAGNLYVADTNGTYIRKVTQAGEVSTLAGSIYGHNDGQGKNAQFSGPTGIAIDRAGNLYVTDKSIRKVTPEGEVSTLAWGSGTWHVEWGCEDRFGPSVIAIDAADNLYTVDEDNSCIHKVTLDGKVSAFAGNGGGFADGERNAAQFWSPGGIAIDAAGNLYVADTNNHRIRKVTPEGKVSTLAGGVDKEGKGGFADGEGSVARFNAPYGIAIDAMGNLYVTDKGNHRIRKITIQLP